MLAFSDLISPLQPEKVEESIYSVLDALEYPRSTWVLGDPEPTLITAFARVVSLLWNKWAYYAIRGGFLDLAERDWLTFRAWDTYRVKRITARFASGEVTITNTTGSLIGPFGSDDVSFANKDNGRTYRNAEPFSVGGGGSVTIKIIADELGSKSNAAPGEIEFLRSIVGLTVANAAPIMGRDEESDEALRERCRLSLGALSPCGPASAYEYVARTPELNGDVTVTRCWVSNSSEVGAVEVILSSPSGPVSPSDVELVDAALRTKVTRMDSITLTTRSAIPKPFVITYQGWGYGISDADKPGILLRVHDALSSYFSTLRIGGDKRPDDVGRVFRDGIEATIRSAAPELFHVQVTSMGDSVVLDYDEVPTLSNVSGVLTASQQQ